MHATTPLNELITSLAQLGWEFKGLKTKKGTFVATAKNPQTGQDIERTGNSPEMAVHAVFQYAQRANSIRAFASGQTRRKLLQYRHGDTNGQDWQEAPQEGQGASVTAAEEAAEGSLGQEVGDLWWPEWEHIDDISQRTVVPHQGYRDTGLIEGAVGNARMAQSYGKHADIFDTAADIIAKVQRQQAVVEGNKRTATALGLHFLQENGYNVDRVAEEPFWSELVEAIWMISDAADPLGQEAINRTAQVLREASVPVEQTDPGRQGLAYVSCTHCDLEEIPESGLWIKAGSTAKCPTCGEAYDNPNPRVPRLYSLGSVEDNMVAKELGWKFLRFSASGKPIYFWGDHVVLGGDRERMEICMANTCLHHPRQEKVIEWSEAKTSAFWVQALTPIHDLGKAAAEPLYFPVPTIEMAPAAAPAEKEEEKEPVTAALGPGEDAPLYVPEDIMEKPLEEITDVDNPMGWRILIVKPYENTLGLFSPTYSAFWPFGKALKADRLPEKNANWGINIVKEDKLHILEGYKNAPWVQVKVVSGGMVWPYADGYRAEYALPYEILVPEGVKWYGKWTSDEVAKILRKNYVADTRVARMGAENYNIPDWGFEEQQIELSDGWTGMWLREGRGGFNFLVYDPEEVMRAELKGQARSTDLTLDAILDGTNQPLSEPEAIEKVQEVIEWWKGDANGTINWAQDSEQGRDQDHYESYTNWDNQEVESVDDIRELLRTWRNVQQNPGQYTEFQPGDSYSDTEWTQESEESGGPILDEFGLPLWFLRYTEYPPTAINLGPEEWRNVYTEVIDHIAADNWNGRHLTEEEIDEAAQALYGLPAFLASGDIGGSQFDGKSLGTFFQNELDWGIQYALGKIGGAQMAQEETLFDAEEYGKGIGLQAHPKLNRFFNLMHYYSSTGSVQRGAPEGQPGYGWVQWNDPVSPEWGQRELTMPGTLAKKQRDPNYIWIWYKSELRVEDWNHNRKHSDMLDELFDEFGRDFSNEVHEVEADQVAAGVVYEYSDGSFKIEHEQMNDPEIRDYAEAAIEDWLGSWVEVTFKKKRKKKASWDENPKDDWVVMPFGQNGETGAGGQVYVVVMDPRGSMGGFDWYWNEQDANKAAAQLGDLALGVVPLSVEGKDNETVTDEIDYQLPEIERSLGYTS